MNSRANVLAAMALGALFGCEKVGAPTEDECPGKLMEADQTCSDPDCTANTGLKIFGQSELDSLVATEWVVPVFDTSEVAAANEMTTIRYRVESAGALSRSNGQVAREDAALRARAFYGAAFDALYGGDAAARVRAEAAIRAEQKHAHLDLSRLKGTGIRPLIELPKNIRKQGATCSASAPSCGTDALCVIPSGTSDGTCETTLSIKFKNGAQVTDVPSTVKKVGTFGAIVVDDTLNVPQDQIDQLLSRFDTHIAPLDHKFFGEPKNQGKDRDGNGVVIIFLTPKVGERGIANLAGYFASDDLGDPATDPSSNGADILYMREPSSTITLDQLSGTIGHEYFHLIEFYAKTILNQSEREEVWLDEGLATFAEDMLGYGSDAFENIAGYLGAVDQTSLTGDGNCPDNNPSDSICRRGMAALLVRYYFEQKGGATFGGAGEADDTGGIAAVKKLVQSSETGTSLFAQANSGRAFHQWVGDLITTVANDGAGFAGVSCNPMYKLDPPETSSFTNYQRGIDLHTAFTTAKGKSVPLNGPIMTDMTTEDVPLVANGGEVRKLSVSTGKMNIAVGGSVDYEVGYHALPATK